MRLAHVRERHAPAGAPWRLAAALDPAAATWLDVEVARRRAVAARPGLAHDSVLHRQPVTTLDDHLARGLRVEALADLVEAFAPPERRRGRRASSTPTTSTSGRRSCGPPRSATSTPSSSTSARCGGDATRRSPRPGTACRSSTSRTCPRSAGRARPVWAPRGSRGARLRARGRRARSTRRPRTSPPERGEEAIGGYFDPQRLVGARPPARRDGGPARARQGQGLRRPRSGPWLVTPDELADRARARLNGARPRHDGDGPDDRRPGRRDVARLTGATIHHSFGAMIERAVGGRPPAPGRRARQRHRRRRLPARGPRGDARSLPRARRRGDLESRAAGPASSTPIVGAVPGTGTTQTVTGR